MAKFSDHLRQHVTPERASVPLCVDRTLLSRLKDAEGALDDVKSAKEEPLTPMLGEEADPRIQGLEDEVEALRKEVEEKTTTFVFETIGRRRWADLVAEHPPTEEQAKKFGEVQGFNEETFIPAAMAASCVEPELTEDDGRFLQENLAEGVWNRLLGALFQVNVVGSRDPLLNGSVAVRPSVQK